jgi:hypothetical protein
MGLDVIRQTIDAIFEANWTATPVIWENVPLPVQPSQSYVQLTLLPADGYKASLGTRNSLHRWEGLLDCGVYVPRGKGMGEAWRYADMIVDMLLNVTQNGVTLYTPYPTPSGENDQWYRLTVTVPWDYNEVR